MSTPDPRGGHKPTKSKGISPAATNAAAETAAKADARRGIALTLPSDVVDAVAVIAEETGKGQRAVLADLATEAAPTLMSSLARLNSRYEHERKARIAKALGQEVVTETAGSYDAGMPR